MRILILLAAVAATGCATDPSSSTATARDAEPTKVVDAANASPAKAESKQPKVVPERVKGAYRMVVKNGEKRYCRKELATGSHVNYRSICLTPEEYERVGQRDQQALRDALGAPIAPATLPSPY